MEMLQLVKDYGALVLLAGFDKGFGGPEDVLSAGAGRVEVD